MTEEVQKTAKAINKEFGEGALIQLGTDEIQKIPSVPTGLVTLDHYVLGIGGVPKGRITEVFGPESSGKTTLALRLIANAQKLGLVAALVDVEHAFDPVWATINGVDVPELFVSQPSHGEEALSIVERLVESGVFGIIVLDSVAALVPKAELDGEMGDAVVGAQARLMSQAMRKLTPKVSKSETCLVFINQLREKIGVMFGSPEVTTGGKALKFYATVRLDVRKRDPIKEGENVVGHKVKIKAIKNKAAVPFKEVEVDLLFASGFDTFGCLFDVAVTAGIVSKAGAWYSFDGKQLGQGRTAAIKALAECAKEIESRVNKLWK